MTQYTQPSKAALEAHQKACAREEAGYIDPKTKLFVLTSFYLTEQGECCGNGCRHCPWPKEEQQRAGRDPDAPAWPYKKA